LLGQRAANAVIQATVTDAVGDSSNTLSTEFLFDTLAPQLPVPDTEFKLTSSLQTDTSITVSPVIYRQLKAIIRLATTMISKFAMKQVVSL